MAGFEAEKWIITAIAIIVSLLTLFSMVKIWNEVFWKPSPGQDIQTHEKVYVSAGMVIPLSILAVMTILLGIFGGYFIEISTRAAEQLLHPDSYINQVLKR